MSWFSNRFSASFRAPESPNGDGEQVDVFTAQGSGVKEDLSELTKTFTRQLWGVASFLAPPPSARAPLEQVDPPSLSSPACHVQSASPSDPFMPSGESSLPNELVDVDFHTSAESAQLLPADSSDQSPSSGKLQTLADSQIPSLNQNSDHGLTGIGKDLAELKGSVAIGFSRILKVVRDEIDRNEKAKQQIEGGDDEDDDLDDESESSVQARKLPVFNSLLKPLLGSIVHNDESRLRKTKTADDGSDNDYEAEYDDDPVVVHGHHMSRPPDALNLQRTLTEGIGGISKLASSLFPISLDSDDEHDQAARSEIGEAVGLTDEVLAFAKNISMHPETWLDFPWFDDDDDDDDFEMSNAQKEHVREVEHASPRLAALRIELCPDYMSEGRFWKIYFVLLHSRLSKKDALLLSTPQIMEARALLRNNLQKKELQGSEAESGRHPEHVERERTSSTTEPQSFKIVSLQSATEVPAKDFDQLEIGGLNQGRSQTSGQATMDMAEEKNVLVSTVKLATLNLDEEEADADRWLHEDTSPNTGAASAAVLGNEDDVSFSDLEEDDDSFASKTGGSSSIKGSRRWVQLDKDQAEPEFEKLGIASKGKLKGELLQNSTSKEKQGRHEPIDWLTFKDEDVDFD